MHNLHSTLFKTCSHSYTNTELTTLQDEIKRTRTHSKLTSFLCQSHDRMCIYGEKQQCMFNILQVQKCMHSIPSV